ncbi:transcriptional regulator [Glaciecola sp. MH2013]|uniref:sigma-E factor negative regulatory protein n=1 Tax=Glaciecola sp. MH2013 TaxID=2785524 RepID=UPI00189EFF04|nr:RseA family anti-sigma factor [Glaciecola sp. MH2013]MBF7074731.1 transcriptional regulator [Glaciecola sp. MH2013]
MTQQQEKLSAFFDGEDEANELIDSLNSNKDLSDKWKRYHLARDCMRNEMTADVHFDISAKVAAQLENEFAIVAPKRTWKELPVVASVIPLLKQSGQLAVAACVTAVMIFSYQTYNAPEATQPFLTAPTSGPLGGLAPVSLSTSEGISEEQMTKIIEHRRQLNAIIEDHERQKRLKNTGMHNTNQSQSTESEVEESAQPQN